MKLRRQAVQRLVVFVAVVAGMLIYVTSQWGPSGHRSGGSGSAPPPVALQPQTPGSSGSAGGGFATSPSPGSSGSLGGSSAVPSSPGSSGSLGGGSAVPSSPGSSGSLGGSSAVPSSPGSSGSLGGGSAVPSSPGSSGSLGGGSTVPSSPGSSGSLGGGSAVPSSPGSNGSPGAGSSTGPLAQSSPPPAQADYFTTARLDRERAQSEEIDLLKSLAANPQAAGSARRAAGRKLIAVATRIRQEARAEDLLKAKGYREALVFLDAAGATAVVRAASLSETDVARIAETVTGATGVPASRINILAEE